MACRDFGVPEVFYKHIVISEVYKGRPLTFLCMFNGVDWVCSLYSNLRVRIFACANGLITRLHAN